MLIFPILLASYLSTATPADLGNCVDDEAIELAASTGSSADLAAVAVRRCAEVLDRLVVARNAAAAKDGERAADRAVHAAAYRRNVTMLLTRSAKATIDDRRASR